MKRILALPVAFMKQAVDAGAMGPERIKHQAIIKDHEEGMNVQQIADKHCVSKRWVHELVKKYR